MKPFPPLYFSLYLKAIAYLVTSQKESPYLAHQSDYHFSGSFPRIFRILDGNGNLPIGENCIE